MAVASRPIAKHEITIVPRLRLQNLESGLGHRHLVRTVTGFIVDDEDEAVQALNRLGELDRRKVRARFEQRFSAERMAQDYVGHYKGVAAAEASTAGKSRRSAVAESKERSQTSSHDFFQSLGSRHEDPPAD